LNMAEIKSTLELIMEKTKGLTPSDKEKREFKEREAAGRIKGLVQKVVDGHMNLEQLQKETAALEGEGVGKLSDRIKEDCAGRISVMGGLMGENAKLMRLLEATTGVDIRPVQEQVEAARSQLEKDKSKHEKDLKENLRKRGISGSAVVPNLEADPEWNRHLQKMDRSLQEKVKEILLQGRQIKK
jgi:hypothetical protein